ncbi:competence/damage-inducible protein A [Paratissierella segnis]|jgi:nicotinamide-nucleotide amidase|uniref:competence/damage-inducible protein A n=1 Tax=Paratissierella segnis TaxID=2763679 RepID=UPI00223C49E5|nr:competence/damage-inducible protein A [Paratissierella segnis]
MAILIAEILTIGTEVITGSILNTNAQYLAGKLMDLGIEPIYHTSVDDNKERLRNVFKTSLDRADIIITTGGLGPTQDDLTKEVISSTLELPLERDSSMEENIRMMFQNMHRDMTENNLKQAERPLGSQFIENSNGTAPGIFINKNGKKIILLPGPPKEMIPMFENYVAGLIKEDYTIIQKSANLIGIGESALETELKKLDVYTNGFEIATFAKDGEVEIKIIGKGKVRLEVEEKVNEILDIINKKFSEFIYGYDNIPIEELVLNRLKEKRFKMSLCESCTGGLITSRLTGISGASEVLDRGLVTYSNQAKIDELNVKPLTLENHGAVSRETAYEMAKGLIEKTNSDIVLSITGIAGPLGGSIEKPVGLVYMCVMTRDNYKIYENHFTGNRTSIQNRATIKAFYEIFNFLR